MEEGHIENLPGKGRAQNPTKNDCAPEWVELNKEICGMIVRWRSVLRKAWAKRCEDDGSTWQDDCRALQEQICQINDKVFPYNLIVPFGRQMSGLKWDRELDKEIEVRKEHWATASLQGHAFRGFVLDLLYFCNLVRRVGNQDSIASRSYAVMFLDVVGFR